MRIGGYASVSVSSSDNGANILNKLNPGDTIRAQILDNSGSELTLKLSDGSTVSTAAMSPVNASEGEFVNFTFKGVVDGKPTFEVAGKTASIQVDETLQDIKNTLASIKLPLTDRNIQLAKALKEQNVPVTPESMAKMQELLSKSSELKPDTAAFLMASKLSGDANNIKQLQNLLAGRLKIGNDISELVKLLNTQNSSPESINSGSSEAAGRLLGKIAVELASRGVISGTAINNLISGNDANIKSSGTILTGSAPGGAAGTLTTSGSSIPVGTSGTPGPSEFSGQLGSTVNTITLESSSSRGTDAVTGNNTAGSNNTASADPTAAAVKSSETGASPDKIPADAPNTHQTQNAAQTKNDLFSNLSVSGSHPEQTAAQSASPLLSNLLKGGMPLDKNDLPLLDALHKQLEIMISKGDMPSSELSIAKQLSSEISSAVFKVNSHELLSLFVRIDQKSEEINPVKMLNDMDSALQSVKNSVQQLPRGVREAAAALVNNLESNVNFINQLNNYSSYVQLPLSIFNQNTTGELYMLKKGSKSRKLDPFNLTVLISLDSNNIGRIDTLLSVDKKNISTNFRLEKSDVFDVLKENHKMLYNNLLDKGFRLVDFTYRLMDEPINIINFEAEAKKEFIRSPNNIDVLI